MRIAAGITIAIAMLGCRRDPPRTGVPIMNKTPPVVITGTTTTFKPDGTKQESYSSPRITLDAHGDVVLEERLSTTGVLVLRRHLGRDQRVEDEDHFTPDGALDYRIAYRYDGSGRIAEEIMNFGDGTPHGRWVHHRDPHGRLLDRELIHPDGRSGSPRPIATRRTAARRPRPAAASVSGPTSTTRMGESSASRADRSRAMRWIWNRSSTDTMTGTGWSAKRRITQVVASRARL